MRSGRCTSPLHHVGFRADGPGEEFGAFQKGNAGFAVAVEGEHPGGGAFDMGEDLAFRGEKVGKAFDLLNFVHGFRLLGKGEARVP